MCAFFYSAACTWPLVHDSKPRGGAIKTALSHWNRTQSHTLRCLCVSVCVCVYMCVLVCVHVCVCFIKWHHCPGISFRGGGTEGGVGIQPPSSSYLRLNLGHTLLFIHTNKRSPSFRPINMSFSDSIASRSISCTLNNNNEIVPLLQFNKKKSARVHFYWLVSLPLPGWMTTRPVWDMM